MNKVWTYIISRELPDTTLKIIQELGESFVEGWTAHEHQLSASFEIYKKRIIIIRVNEAVNSASGCSIDKLLRFIKKLESQFSIELLNRLLVAYREGENIQVAHSGKIKQMLEEKVITEDTIIYKSSVSSESELAEWEQPLKDTWLNKYLVKN